MKLMAKLVLVCSLAFFFIYTSAGQNTSESVKKEDRATKKQEKKEKEEANYKILQETAQNQQFVVEFTRINEVPLTGSLNFIKVDGDVVTMQVQTPDILAQNGLGGRTWNGQLSDYKYTPAKELNKPFYVQFNFRTKTTTGPVEITITVSKGGYTTVYMGGNTNIYGDFVVPDDSQIQQGLDMKN